jgi:hypothetical protein
MTTSAGRPPGETLLRGGFFRGFVQSATVTHHKGSKTEKAYNRDDLLELRRPGHGGLDAVLLLRREGSRQRDRAPI